ncbi:hypothetical protein Ddc_10808 [Ditylenchus destructor]|nr:hypothetical protein Ddc_10808 [Ditylenchus destructor]
MDIYFNSFSEEEREVTKVEYGERKREKRASVKKEKADETNIEPESVDKTPRAVQETIQELHKNNGVFSEDFVDTNESKQTTKRAKNAEIMQEKRAGGKQKRDSEIRKEKEQNSLEAAQELNENDAVSPKGFAVTKEGTQNKVSVDRKGIPKGRVLEENDLEDKDLEQKDIGELSLRKMMSNVGDKSIEILKMDVGGGKMNIIDEIFELSICQVLMEVRLQEAKKIYKILHKFSQHGYYLFDTGYSALRLDIREYNFIHESCLAKYDVTVVLGKYLS